MRVLVDTNVFVKAFYKEPNYIKCINFVSDPKSQMLASSITFTEVIPVISRKSEDSLYEALVEIEKTIGPNIVPITKELAKIAGHLKMKYKFGVADAIILASALLSGCDALATTDSDFDSVDEIKILKL